MNDSYDIFDSALVGAPGDRILLPLMGYPSEKDAIFISLVSAEYFGSILYVYHIASKNLKTEEFFHKELDWLKEKAKVLNVSLEVVIQEQMSNTKPHKLIVQKIDEITPKLTIMMSRRKGLFQKLSGSTAERVARESPYSVIIIRSPIKDWMTYGSHIEPRKIIVPIGSESPCELFATQIAIAIANAGKNRDAEITLLHVITVPETVPIITEDDKMIIQEEKAFIKQAGQYSTMLLWPMKTKVIIGRDVGRSVSQYVNKEHADLVVMGVPYLPGRVLGLYGRDTNEIFHKSLCPVVLLFRKMCS